MLQIYLLMRVMRMLVSMIVMLEMVRVYRKEKGLAEPELL